MVGLSRYLTALGLLFDADYSAVRLLGIQVTGPRTIEADYTSGGYLKLPWHPRVEPYTGGGRGAQDPPGSLAPRACCPFTGAWDWSPGNTDRKL